MAKDPNLSLTIQIDPDVTPELYEEIRRIAFGRARAERLRMLAAQGLAHEKQRQQAPNPTQVVASIGESSSLVKSGDSKVRRPKAPANEQGPTNDTARTSVSTPTQPVVGKGNPPVLMDVLRESAAEPAARPAGAPPAAEAPPPSPNRPGMSLAMRMAERGAFGKPAQKT